MSTSSFFFVYLSLFLIDQIVQFLPRPVPFYLPIWHAIVPWFAANVLHLETPITTFTNGSGDTTYNYVQILCFAILAAFTTAVWYAFDRERPNYNRLHHFLRVGVRYFLAWAMIVYGVAKIWPTQFPPPSFSRLIQDYGVSSPMGLVWTFMGASPMYSFFAGLAELTGLLLFFRRTATIGALLVAVVMSNVVMINMSYDVPVKILSIHLFLMAVFLAAPQFSRLFDVFFRHRAVAPEGIVPHDPRPRVRALRLASKYLFIVTVSFLALKSTLSYDKLLEPKPYGPLFGIYNVDTFVHNGVTLPPLLTDRYRWKRFATSPFGYSSVQAMGDSLRGYTITPDTIASTVVMTRVGTDSSRFEFTYRALAGGAVELNNDSLHIVLQPVDLSSFTLTNRGFHWINERPYNR